MLQYEKYTMDSCEVEAPKQSEKSTQKVGKLPVEISTGISSF
jgi:hypothetical protein